MFKENRFIFNGFMETLATSGEIIGGIAGLLKVAVQATSGVVNATADFGSWALDNIGIAADEIEDLVKGEPRQLGASERLAIKNLEKEALKKLRGTTNLSEIQKVQVKIIYFTAVLGAITDLKKEWQDTSNALKQQIKRIDKENELVAARAKICNDFKKQRAAASSKIESDYDSVRQKGHDFFRTTVPNHKCSYIRKFGFAPKMQTIDVDGFSVDALYRPVEDKSKKNFSVDIRKYKKEADKQVKFYKELQEEYLKLIGQYGHQVYKLLDESNAPYVILPAAVSDLSKKENKRIRDDIKKAKKTDTAILESYTDKYVEDEAGADAVIKDQKRQRDQAILDEFNE
jgi:hypothetical protein